MAQAAADQQRHGHTDDQDRGLRGQHAGQADQSTEIHHCRRAPRYDTSEGDLVHLCDGLISCCSLGNMLT